MDDLSILIPLAVEVKVGGKTLALTPLKVGELSAFSRAVSPIIASLNGGDIDLFRLITDHSESVIDAVAVAVREPREWINDLTVGELVLLAAKVIEVNADFFTRGVVPNLAQAFEGALLSKAEGLATIKPAADGSPSSSA